ncbi:MAG: hypothetical protein CL609_06815 [Anaerolineaceae bacterium]|nr:hypothetical protein [Anaerolineaceae bacterium]
MNSKKTQMIVKLFFGILLTINLVSLISIFQISPDPKNAFLWGYSLARWGLIALEVISLIAILFLLIRSFNQGFFVNIFGYGEKFITNHKWVSGTILFFTLVLVLSPPYRFGLYAAVFERLNPLIDFLGIALFIYLFFVFVCWENINSSIKIDKKLLRFGLFIYAFLLILWLFIFLTRIGLEIDYFHWGGAATPVLFSTIVIAAYLTFNFTFLIKRINNKKIVYLLIPIILYFGTYILWQSQPFTPSFFAPEPVAPNYEFYPYSDAHYYAMTSQSLLVGEGYMNRGVVQKPIYGFLIYLFSLLGGQDYFSIINLQILFFAVFPVLIYLLGKHINGPNFGIFIALIAIIREITAYRTTPFIEVIHSKLLMTDFFAAIFAVWISLLLIRIVKSKKNVEINIVFLGVVTGMGLMVRFNILFLIFPIVFTLLFLTQHQFKKKIIHSVIFAISCFLILLPWMIRNYYYIGEFGVENSKIRAVIDTRFEENEKTQPTPNPSNPKPDLMVINDHNKGGIDLVGIIKFTSANFLHNEIHSILILPNTFELVNVEHLINENEYFYETWEGNVNFKLIIFTFINLFILSIGLIIALRKIGPSGLLPFVIHIFYNLSNGLGRVSGWRYVLVTDWVIYLYYVLALFSAILWLGRKLKLINQKPNEVTQQEFVSSKRLPILGTLIFVLFSIGMILPEAMIKPMYPGYISCEQSLKLASNPNYSNMLTELDPCDNTDKIILYEKALYPKYYPANKGEPGVGLPWLNPQKSDHLGFSIVGPVISGVVLEAQGKPPRITNSQEVIIIGSWNNSVQDYPYIDADVVFFLEDNLLLKRK